MDGFNLVISSPVCQMVKLPLRLQLHGGGSGRPACSILYLLHSGFDIAMQSLRATVPQIPLDQGLVEARQGRLNFSRVLFLDIDGVLHPELPTAKPQFCYLRNFHQTLRRVDPLANMPVVISSDWKLHHPLMDLKMRFPPDLAQQIVGVTPDHFGFPHGNRESEINTWMNQHAATGDWLAIDDRPRWFQAGCMNLFVVAGVKEGGSGGLDSAVCQVLQTRLSTFLGPSTGDARA